MFKVLLLLECIISFIEKLNFNLCLEIIMESVQSNCHLLSCIKGCRIVGKLIQ